MVKTAKQKPDCKGGLDATMEEPLVIPQPDAALEKPLVILQPSLTVGLLLGKALQTIGA